MKTLIAKLSGSITIGSGDYQLHKQIRSAMEQGYDSAIFDMEEVNYMDSSAVGELVWCFKSITEEGGQMALANLQPKVKELLQILSFLDLFLVCDSVEDALQIMRNRNQSAERELVGAC